MTKLGRPEEYPWKKWFARKQFTLTKGKHFDIAIHGMAQMIRNAARKERHNIKVSLKIDGDTINVSTSPRKDP